ncbi:FMN-binding protein [Faecalicatena contorta]|uniref:Major membrane immunogen, membrane-anchored lipoprotein n=1 Tax=Faecalicatena contorta TaxID=39482 RepID=A0A315ZYS0_9FIRM|nr:FMN-binding protein [Faecalicatena contorta]PWJ50811.1 major membrane immunogen (membrane-anchored lipoprotein) [Faecalicatena contorta]SUQ13379.1 Major membrane immunogen, membrane-anchored lipoprotein [Faecalicatena contorta]
MKITRKIAVLLFFTVFVLQATACGADNKMKDGYYTAEMGTYSHGWKEYVCIMVKDNQIISAEYNAKNESGFIKAWDNEYMKNMNSVTGTYPNDYTRRYVSQLIEDQSAGHIDIISGATSSGGQFRLLAEAVILQAMEGNPEKVIIESAEEES